MKMTYEEEQKMEKNMHDKFIAALKTIGIKVKVDKNEKCFSGLGAELGAHQSLYCRVNSYGHKGKFNITTSSSKEARDKDVYTSGKEFTCFEINITHTKTIEQIGRDIQKRILDTPEFTKNYEYIERTLKVKEQNTNDLKSNIEFMSKSGLLFSDNKNDVTASKWKSLGVNEGYLDIEAKANSDMQYCEMKLRGLSKEQWLKIFKVLKPIIEEK